MALIPHSADWRKEVACMQIVACKSVSPIHSFPDLIIQGQRFLENAKSTTAIPPAASKPLFNFSYSLPLAAI
jgi:hypothetical protein